jgi:hypothetical protein
MKEGKKPDSDCETRVVSLNVLACVSLMLLL